MASKALLLTMIFAVIAVPALATDYVVGDDAGWKLNFNYTAWAQGKYFFVGDRIIFNYTVGVHNVHKVNGTAFQQCAVPPPSEALTTGNDVITLATPGRKWYICGVGRHCDAGMKLVITVADPASSPVPVPVSVSGLWNCGEGCKEADGILEQLETQNSSLNLRGLQFTQYLKSGYVIVSGASNMQYEYGCLLLLFFLLIRVVLF